MKAIDRWSGAALAVGLTPIPHPDDPGVLMLFAPGDGDQTGRTVKVGLIVIRDEGVTYAELDGHVVDTITSDRRPLNVQLSERMRERAR